MRRRRPASSASCRPSSRGGIARTCAAYGEYWHDLFVSAQAAGQIDGDVDLFVARMLAFGAMNWTSEWFVAGKEMSADDLADQTVRMFLHGVASA